MSTILYALAAGLALGVIVLGAIYAIFATFEAWAAWDDRRVLRRSGGR